MKKQTHHAEHNPESSEIKFSSDWYKKIKLPYVLLVLIVILGVYLRFYHIDYPTIGYHNMKEDEFLSFALNMHDSGDYLRTTWFDCSISTNDYFGDPYKSCNFNEGETPVPVWLLILLFSIFGWKLWVARTMIVVFSVLGALMVYLIAKKLTKNEYLSLLGAFFYTILPLSVFFGRNIQMDAPSLFIGLCSLYFFMKWIDDRRFRTFLYSCALFVLTAWFKPTSLVVLFPLLFLIPYKELLNIKKYKKEYLVLGGTMILSFIWIVFLAAWLMSTSHIAGSSGSLFGKNSWIDTSFSIFSGDYWSQYRSIIGSYISDNYSWTGFWVAMIGFALFFLNRKSTLSKFMFGYAIGIFVYITMFAYKWNAHNYYQYPFLPFAGICIANVFFQAGSFIKALAKKEWAKFIPLVAILLLLGPFKASTNQQFNTQFFGQDVAGAYINQHTQPGEIFLLERGIQHQVSWTARRFYYSVPDDVETLKKVEQEKNLTYIVMTNYGLSTIQQKKSWPYIVANYKIAELGFVQTQQGPQVYHMVLERGGKFNLTELNNKKPVPIQVYEMGSNKITYYIINN